MNTNNIPADIQQQALAIIERFNEQELKGVSSYIPRFKSTFLFLDRADYGSAPSEVCRLKYKGSLDDWDFAIFKYSSDTYDPDDWFIPGSAYLDGSIEGAMRCGMLAYPA